MEQYRRNQAALQTPQPQQYETLQEGMQPKKILSRSFFALFIMAVLVNLVQVAIQLLAENFMPGVEKTDWFVWALTLVSFVGIGFPVYYIIIRKVPDSPKREVTRVSPVYFIAFFFICVAAMYITNFMTQIIVVIITFIKGGELVNPAAEAILDSNFIISLIYVSLVAPVVEELIFRKILLHRLRRFGDVPAILMTGFAFGLFHFNLLQFFYAVALGILFAYITIRTNTIVYSIMLHMLINFISTIITPFIVDKNIIVIMLVFAWVLISVTAGILFFTLNIRKIRLEKTAPLMKTSSYILNPGVIMFLSLSVVLFVIATLV